MQVIQSVMESFRPGSIVLQCGADSLAGVWFALGPFEPSLLPQKTTDTVSPSGHIFFPDRSLFDAGMPSFSGFEGIAQKHMRLFSSEGKFELW